MRIVYTARKVNLRDNFKERVEKKLQKLLRLQWSYSGIIAEVKRCNEVTFTVNCSEILTST